MALAGAWEAAIKNGSEEVDEYKEEALARSPKADLAALSLEVGFDEGEVTARAGTGKDLKGISTCIGAFAEGKEERQRASFSGVEPEERTDILW
ncbi:hypothetical protein HPP92_016591 [Vanilla planifolia]|uniref:Uncharacterized protein n=1 Tax=Vanilla planifolia TaxID=51239 RepID=A0A835QFI2_VANPL|nr:hypothetical protein HPP92_016591 [Vanilla planifolia]